MEKILEKIPLIYWITLVYFKDDTYSLLININKRDINHALFKEKDF